MAVCKVIKPRPAVTEDTYLLRLTREEAITLRLIGHRVGGSPAGRRGDMDAISRALSEAGIPEPQLGNTLDMPTVGHYSEITFNDTRTDVYAETVPDEIPF